MADIIPDQSISGNKIAGGVVTRFSSTGIQDLATKPALIVTDETITVNSVNTSNLNGNVSVNGNLSVNGSVDFVENIQFLKDLFINGNLTANTLTVRTLKATVTQETKQPLTFLANFPGDLNGMGLLWKVGDKTDSLVYQNGSLTSNININLNIDSSFSIAGTSVLNSNTLGKTVTFSSLTQVGRLTDLTVDGAVKFNKTFETSGAVSLYNTLNVAGAAKFSNITADVVTASKFVTTDGADSAGSFAGDTEADLIGKGFHWSYANKQKHLIYREGNRLWSNLSLDLDADQVYKIDNTTVLSRNALGSSITRSNLQEIGELNELVVSGNAIIGEFAFFNASDLRLGIGTETPNAAIEIVDAGTNIVIGKKGIGTYSNHDLNIVTDNITRILVKNNGEVVFGDAVNKNAVVRINGELHVTSLVADTRTERDTPLEFKAGNNSNIYGKGLIWTGTGSTRQLVMMGNPDRLWTTESFEIAQDQCYYIGGRPVLTQGELGSTVITSSLTKVGILESLTVRGNAQFDGQVKLSSLQTASVTLTEGTSQLVTTPSSFNASHDFTLRVQENDALYFDSKEITIGSKTNTRRPVKIFGSMSVGINNPDPTVGLSVAGDVSFNNKKFVNGTEAPITGEFRKGDICWNQQPTLSGYVGWICLVDGTPGVWAPFGQIANQ
jgi:cytoskeletal protein CcmA (bactofilin family)